MATPVTADRVMQTTTSTGTGNLSLAGAPSPEYQTFGNAFGAGSFQPFYVCVNPGTGEWEVGIGAILSISPSVLIRSTILASSNGGAAVNFSAGAKLLFNQIPAAYSVVQTGNFTSGPGTVAAPSIALVEAGTGFYKIGTNNPGFSINGTKLLDLSAALVEITGGLSLTTLLDLSAATAGQVEFPATQNPSSNVNTLDHYVEGTFTPTLTSTGGGTPTYATQVGTYTRIGNRCLFQLRISLATLGSLAAGGLAIGTLPFTSDATTGNVAALAITANNLAASAATAITAQIGAGASVLSISRFAAGVQTQLTVADITGTAILNVNGQYQC